MKHPANLTLFDHWRSLRRGRQVPERNDLDPVAIRGVLSFTFMLEVDGKLPATRSYPIRVSGTRLDALFGRSVKDSSFTALWQPRHRATLQMISEAVLDEGRPAVIGAVAGPAGFAPVAVEMLMMPLRCNGQTHARLFCSLVPLTSPAWLGLDGVGPLDLTTWRLIETSTDTIARRITPKPSPLTLTPTDLWPRFTVVAGGKAPAAGGEAPVARESPADLQHRIKAVVQGSGNAPLSVRSQ